MKRASYIDALRGLAVILMIQTHVFDAWSRPEARVGSFWRYVKISGGAPSAMFLFLAGVSLAFGFRSAARMGMPLAEAQRKAVRRAAGLLAAAFLLRLQFYLLGGRASDLLRVDILNCMSVTLALAAFLAAPRLSARSNWAAMGIAALIAFVSPWVAQLWLTSWGARFPTSYVHGDKPLVLFPLFPWSAFTFAGLAAGGIWSDARSDARRMRRVMLWTAVMGLALFAVGYGLHVSPLRLYERVEFWRTSPNFFFIRLGVLLLLSVVAWAVYERLDHRAVDPLRQLGMTSLFVYWIHIELAYGKLSRLLHHRFSLGQTALGVVALTLLMLALSVARTRVGTWWAGRRRAAFTSAR